MIPFGKKIRVGNFYVLKTTVSIGRKELAEMRKEKGIKDEIARKLRRGGMPVITIGDIGGGWKVTYSPSMSVYQFVEQMDVTGDGTFRKEEEESSMRNLILIAYMGSTILGDRELNMERVRIHNEYAERAGGEVKSEESADEKSADDEITEQLAKEHRDAENIGEMMRSASD